MARLVAVERFLFYPTPLEIVELIASNIKPSSTGGAILDPCAGTGEPLQLLGKKLGLTTYGNEIHPQRYAIARQLLDHCLNGAREFLQISGRFNVLLDNPPYDWSLSGSRMELDHLIHDLTLLTLDGLGVWIIPESTIDRKLCYLLASTCRQIHMRRVPSPEYEKFHQVVIFGIKRNHPSNNTGGYGYYSFQSQAEQLLQGVARGLPVLRANEFEYTFYSASGDEIGDFAVDFPDAGTISEEVETQGVQTTPVWEELFEADCATFENFQPVMKLSAGHAAWAIASGVANGVEVTLTDSSGDQEICLLKGSTEKRIEKSSQVEQAEDDETEETVREKERLVHQIILLGLQTGRIYEYNNVDDPKGFVQFLTTHQEMLIESVERTCQPLFMPERDMGRWLPILEKVRAPGLLPGQKEAGRLLREQEIRAAALATCLKKKNVCLLIGEMGTGKTSISLAALILIRIVALATFAAWGSGEKNWKLVIVCPPQVTAKWRREVENVLYNFGVSVHLIGKERKQPHALPGRGRQLPDINGPRPELAKIKSCKKPILDVIRAMEEPGPSVLVVSYELAKNAARWEHAPSIEGRIIKRVVTREEQHPTYPYVRKIEEIVTSVEKVLTCPACGTIVINGDSEPMKSIEEMGDSKQKCRQCGSPLWQRVPYKYGGRMAVADFLNRHYPGKFDLCLDESHTTKGATTDAGYSSSDLMTARRVLELTGTIYDGKASGLFHLLYRISGALRSQYRHDEVQRFVNHHGLKETVTKITRDPNPYSSAYGYTRESVRVRELPGVTPGIVMALLPLAVFIKLEHVAEALPPYQELRMPVTLDERFEEGMEQLDQIYDDAVKLAREGKTGLMSAWLYATLGWMDCPVDETLTAIDHKTGQVLRTYHIKGVLSQPDELTDPPLPKDQALLDLIRRELSRERGVGVFFAQVNKRDWMGRIQKLLAKHGIYSEILRRSTCTPNERESWYKGFVQRCRERGQPPVLLTNGNLIREGLDLVELCTIVETGIEFRLSYLRQRIRRSWRLTQEKGVNVIFLYYTGTGQETALKLVAAKLKAALLVDGDLVSGLAEMDSDSDNLMDALIEAIKTRGKTVDKGWNGLGEAHLSDPDGPRFLPPPGNGQGVPLPGQPTFEAVFRDHGDRSPEKERE